MNSPVPNFTLFNEAIFDLIVPESPIDQPVENLHSLQSRQREFIFFDEILTFYLSISIPRLDTSTSEATRVAMLEHWIASLEVTAQSIIHDGSDPLPRSMSLIPSKTPTTPLPPTSPITPLSADSTFTDTSSISQSPLNSSQEDIDPNQTGPNHSQKSSIGSKLDLTSAGAGGFIEPVSFRQYSYTYNRRAPGCRPLVHSKGTVLIPLRVPVAFTPVKTGQPFLSILVIVTQSMLSSATPQTALLQCNSSTIDESEYMPDLHDTVNILGSLKLENEQNENLPSLRIQKFRSHGFQNLPPLRRILQKKLSIQNVLFMSMAGVPQRAKDNTVLLNVIFENATTDEIRLKECLCKEAEPLSPLSSWPIILYPLDQISMVFVYYTHKNSGDTLQVTLIAQYELKHGQPLCSQWVCRMQNPLPIFRAPSSSVPSSAEALPISPRSHSLGPKSIMKKRLSLTEEALLQMTKVFTKNSPFTKKPLPTIPLSTSTPTLPSVSVSPAPAPPPPDFPLILTFTTPDPIYEQDTFYLSIQLINRSPNPRRISVKVPNRNTKSRRPQFDKLFLEPMEFEVLSEAIHSTKESLLCLENELHLKPIPPEATLTVRIQFQALKEGVHSIESLYLVDHTTCRELEINNSLQVFIRKRTEAPSISNDKVEHIVAE